MIRLSELSELKIKEFAGSTIYRRGYDYYKDDMVEEFELDPEKNVFSAVIFGSVGCYDIEVWTKKGYINASCTCPYDGYPCKHIVAVLLYYLNNKNRYLKNIAKQKKLDNVLKRKLASLSKNELINILTSYSKKYPAVKRELSLQLSVDKKMSLEQYNKEIDRVFRRFENDDFSTYEVVRELSKMMKQTESAHSEIRVEIIWNITDNILHVLNEYGMSDEPFEDFVIKTMDVLVDILNNNSTFDNRRNKIRAELDKYCEWGNCGIIDEIGEAAYQLSAR